MPSCGLASPLKYAKLSPGKIVADLKRLTQTQRQKDRTTRPDFHFATVESVFFVKERKQTMYLGLYLK